MMTAARRVTAGPAAVSCDGLYNEGRAMLLTFPNACRPAKRPLVARKSRRRALRQDVLS
jgi:hypothetical protein